MFLSVSVSFYLSIYTVYLNFYHFFGDDFNILEFADALDGNDTNKTNILDDLEAEDEEEDGAKPAQKADGEAKPPPYGPGGNPQDPSRGPPPPYPGQQKVRRKLAWIW